MPVKIRAPKKKETLTQKVSNQYDHLKAWIASRRKVIVSVLILSIVTGGSLAAFLFFTRHAEEKAWRLEAAASQLLRDDSATPEGDKKKETRTDRLNQAAQKYETLLETYPSRQAAAVALYELGHIYFELEKYDLAEAKYLEFLKRDAPEPFLPLVHLKLGYLYNQKKDTTAALVHFRAAYDVLEASRTQGENEKKTQSLSQDQAGFELAKLLEQLEKKSEAIDIYKKVSTTFSESPWGMEAQARLTQLEGGTTTPMAVTSAPVTEPIPTPVDTASPPESVPSSILPTPQPVKLKTENSKLKTKGPLAAPLKTDVAPPVPSKVELPSLTPQPDRIPEGSESTVIPALEMPVSPPDEAKPSLPETSPEPAPPALEEKTASPSPSPSEPVPPPPTASETAP